MDPAIRVSPLVAALVLALPLTVFGAARLLATPATPATSVPQPATEANATPRVVPEFVFLQPPPAGPTERVSSPAMPVTPPAAPDPGDAVAQDVEAAAPVSPARDDVVTAPAATAPAAPGTASVPPAPIPIASIPAAPPDRPPVACGLTTCAPGGRCCNPTCGICAPPGEPCTQQDCGFASFPSSVPCGDNTCNVGQVCCNPSCGICAAPGASCSQTACDDGPTYPVSQACGMTTCVVGAVCCDASCGLCAPAADCRSSHC